MPFLVEDSDPKARRELSTYTRVLYFAAMTVALPQSRRGIRVARGTGFAIPARTPRAALAASPVPRGCRRQRTRGGGGSPRTLELDLSRPFSKIKMGKNLNIFFF